MALNKYFLIVFFFLTSRFAGEAQLPAAANDSLLYYLKSIRQASDTPAIHAAFDWMARSPEQVMLKDEVLQTIEKLRGVVADKTYFDLAAEYFESLEKINTPASNAAYLEKAKPVMLQWGREKSKYGRYSYLILLRNYRLPFRNTGNLMGAIEFYSAYEKQFLAANDSAGVSIATNVLAGFYFRRGIMERGKYYMLKSINYLNDLQEDYNLHEYASLFGISGKLNRYAVLASFYLKEYRYEEASLYLNEAMKYFRQLDVTAYFQDVPSFFCKWPVVKPCSGTTAAGISMAKHFITCRNSTVRLWSLPVFIRNWLPISSAGTSWIRR